MDALSLLLGAAAQAGFGLPPVESVHGVEIDALWDRITWLVGIAFVLVQVLLVGICLRFRRSRPGPAGSSHGRTMLELGWTAVIAAVLAWVGVDSERSWAAIKKARMVEGATVIEVVAERFSWNVRHTGPDGLFDTADDVRMANFVVLPAEEPVVIRLRSHDVIHSFFVPVLRVKQDAVPGLTVDVPFQTLRATGPGPDGEYGGFDDEYFDLACAEFCGDLHYNMAGRVMAYPRAEYDAWVERRLAAQREAEEGGP